MTLHAARAKLPRALALSVTLFVVAVTVAPVRGTPAPPIAPVVPPPAAPPAAATALA